MTVFEILSVVFLFLGSLLLAIGAFGVLKFPDFYSRLHAAGKGDTAGQALVLLGLGVSAGLTLVSLKLALIAFFIFIFNPTATHALARGAWLCGVRPWTGEPERPFPQREGQMSEEERESLYMPIATDVDSAAAAGEEDAS